MDCTSIVRCCCYSHSLTQLWVLPPQIVVKLLPLMIGWFALNVPSGLGLYYLSNTILTTGQQVFLRKLGGALQPVLGLLDTSSLAWVQLLRAVLTPWPHSAPADRRPAGCAQPKCHGAGCQGIHTMHLAQTCF